MAKYEIKNRFDTLWVSRNFVVSEGQLLKKLANGHVKELTTMDGNDLIVRIDGKTLRAADIAWALIYGNWPKWRIVTLDDPRYFVVGNLFPSRIRRYRAMVRAAGERFKHSLSGYSTYSTRDLAERDWAMRVRVIYEKDLPYCLQVEANERIMYHASMPVRMQAPLPPIEEKIARRKRAPNKNPRVDRTTKPEDVPGKKWYWLRGEWVLANRAIHVADDWMARCYAAKAGLHNARFNTETERVEYF